MQTPETNVNIYSRYAIEKLAAYRKLDFTDHYSILYFFARFDASDISALYEHHDQTDNKEHLALLHADYKQKNKQKSKHNTSPNRDTSCRLVHVQTS